MIPALLNLLLVVGAILDKNYEASAQRGKVVWEDNFDGRDIDLRKWEFQTGDGCSISNDMCGWGNGELQWYQQQNAFIRNGNLVIVARKEPSGNGRQYSSARLRTKGKGDWKFGYMEVRAKVPGGRGIWPAIWMLPTDDVHGIWPRSGEIDIMELVGHEPSTVHMTAHFGNAWNQKSQAGTWYRLPNGKFSDGFHTFAVMWRPDSITWFVDGREKYSMNRQSTGGYLYPFNERFHFLLNIAVGGGWPGNPDGSTRFPQEMEVDYVRVMELA